MAINNLLYVDDNRLVRDLVVERLKSDLTTNVDAAASYESGLEQMRRKFYDLIVVDGLNGRCFDLAGEAKKIKQGQIVIFALNPDLASIAGEKGIGFYRKPEDLGKLIGDFSDAK